MVMNHELIQKLAGNLTAVGKFSIKDLLNHPFSKIAMSTGELFQNTSKRSIKYKKGCVATIKRNTPDLGRWMFTVKCNEPWSKGPYDVRFKLLEGKGKKTVGFLGREILISCPCRAWKYNGADFNAKNKGYSERQYSNGDAPNIRDPKRKYLICKHVAACVPILQGFLIPKRFK
jgi:hypothetical protein